MVECPDFNAKNYYLRKKDERFESVKEDCEAEDDDSDINYAENFKLQKKDKIGRKRNQSAINLCSDINKNSD